MKGGLLVLSAIFLSLTQATSINFYPPFAKCDQKIISSIKSYWGLTGSPRNVLDMFNPNEKYFVALTSFNYENEGNECISFEADKSMMNITYMRKDKGTPLVSNYTLIQYENGVIRGIPLDNSTTEVNKVNWYTVHNADGFTVNYLCSNSDESSQPPLTVFWVTQKSFNNYLIRNTIKTLSSLMQVWGFNFLYNYQDVCFPQTTEEGLTSLFNSGSLRGF